MWCVCRGVCACIHMCVWSKLCSPAPTSQQTKQQCQPGNSTPALHPIPFSCSCLGNLFSLHSSSLGSLQSSVPPPAPMASSLLQDSGQALLPLCPIAAERCGDGPQRGEQGAAQASPPCSRHCHKGSGSSASILLLYSPVHLPPVKISAGFACAGAGLVLPRDHAAPRRGRLLLQRMKL